MDEAPADGNIWGWTVTANSQEIGVILATEKIKTKTIVIRSLSIWKKYIDKNDLPLITQDAVEKIDTDLIDICKSCEYRNYYYKKQAEEIGFKEAK
jgi:hypothetical protein